MRPKEYIHVARQRAGAFRFKPRVSPKMAAGGGHPSPGPESESCCPTLPAREVGTAWPLPSARPAQDGSQRAGAALPICATVPQSSEAKGLLWPHPGHLSQPWRKELLTAGPVGGAQTGLLCKLLALSLQLPHGPPSRRVSVALGARQDKSTGPVSPLPQNNSVFFLSAS